MNKVDRWGVGVGVRNKHVNGRDIFRLSFVLKSNHSGHGTANRVQKGVMGKEWEGRNAFCKFLSASEGLNRFLASNEESFKTNLNL